MSNSLFVQEVIHWGHSFNVLLVEMLFLTGSCENAKLQENVYLGATLLPGGRVCLISIPVYKCIHEYLLTMGAGRFK